MEKIQEKKTKRFIIGIVFIVGSIIYGWMGLFFCNALAIKYGARWSVIGAIIYGISWITYGLGFILAGSSGIQYVKKLWKMVSGLFFHLL